MNAQKLVVLAAALFSISSANTYAQMHGRGGSVSAVNSSQSFARPVTGTVNRGNWNGNWRGHCGGRTVFIGSFGFPFWGWGYPIGYPYAYGYPYGYPPYYGGGYYGGGYYGGGYYGSGYDGGGYYGGYSNAGYASYSYGSRSASSQSSVVRLQQRLARAGYYRGPIDGIMGSRTRYALRAYQHDHPSRSYGMTNQ
jgi:Putative peptidoglycan binding domain